MRNLNGQDNAKAPADESAHFQEAGFVYLVKAQDYIKIGTAYNVQTRLRELQVGCPYPMQLLATVPSVNPGMLEALLHSHFDKDVVNGEWFSVSLEQIQEVADRLERLSRRHFRPNEYKRRKLGSLSFMVAGRQRKLFRKAPGGNWYVRFKQGSRSIWRSTNTTIAQVAKFRGARIIENQIGLSERNFCPMCGRAMAEQKGAK